jgi:uncharacterized damage-inducible protein DinB
MSGNATVSVLVRLLDEAYSKQGWHGPNVKGSIRGLDAEAATWRPSPGRHNIRELVLHIAYWKYTVRRRLTGIKRGSFALEGSDWFSRDVADAGAWHEEMALVDAEHRALREEVLKLTDADLGRRVGRHDFARLVFGAAAHDNYHNGQIVMLKRMYFERSGR